MVDHDPAAPVVDRCTAYMSIVAPPLLDGASQVSLTVALPGVAAGDRGAVGALAAANRLTASAVPVVCCADPSPGGIDVVGGPGDGAGVGVVECGTASGVVVGATVGGVGPDVVDGAASDVGTSDELGATVVVDD